MQFDRFLMVDWSAKSSPSPKKPSKDAIWVAEGTSSDSDLVTTTYFRTRRACFDFLQNRLHDSVRNKLKTLVGLDIIYGYPAGFFATLKLKEQPEWRAIWQLIATLIKDDEHNRNNRYLVGGELNRRTKASLGPFWGVPVGQSGIFLGSKKDFTYPIVTKRGTLAEKRLVEQRCPGMQPAWKLAYNGSVGSQGLMGIPYLYQLRFTDPVLVEHSKVWPFDTGFTDSPLSEPEDLILHAEIWPSLIERPRLDEIPDREQVVNLVNYLRERQRAGTLAELFDTPAGLKRRQLKTCVREEGWVLGVR